MDLMNHLMSPDFSLWIVPYRPFQHHKKWKEIPLPEHLTVRGHTQQEQVKNIS